MNSKLIAKVLPPNWLKFLIVILLLLGIFFRFVNLDRKVYSYDEAITSLRISGYTWTEMVQQDFNGNLISVEDLQKKYQQINPEKGLTDTVKGLAEEEAQLPPLYFILARFWVQLFGPGVAVTRSLSAVISLLVFPAVYWLCVELFASALVGWFAIALLAVSPFQVLYAQDARPYILLAVITLLSGAALLRAMRLKTQLSWGIYALTIPLGLYSHLFFGLVAIGQGIYVFVVEGWRLSKTVIAYLLAAVAGFLTFVPWIWVMLANSREINDTVGLPKISAAVLSAIVPLSRVFSRIFVDTHWAGGVIDFGFKNIFTDLIRLALVVMSMSLIGYSLYFLYRHTPKQVWLFIFTLIGITGIFLVATGGISERYLFSCYLAIQLSVAYLLATKITFPENIWQQKLWQIILIALISGGILSSAISSQAQLWSIKYPGNNQYNPVAASIINQATQPLVISHGSNNLTGTILSFSYLLKPKVQLQLVNKPNQIKIPNNFREVFLYKPSKELKYELEKVQNYKIAPGYEFGDIWLWRLEK